MSDSCDSPKTPEELVREARAGSADAFAQLVDRYERPLFEFLRFLSNSERDAEELTQDSFVRAWSKLHLYDSRYAFASWLFTIGRRLAATRRRTRALLRLGDAALAALPGAGDPLRILGRREERDNLWAVAGRVLDDAQRSALWLRYAEDLSYAEIGRVLGRREATVRVHLFRARRKLAAHLECPEEQSMFIHGGPATPASSTF